MTSRKARSLPEVLTEEFYQWERRGRGWHSFPYPVSLEPPFVPFRFSRERGAQKDDGIRSEASALSLFINRLAGRVEEERPPELPVSIEEELPPPHFEEGDLFEVRVLPPSDLSVTPAQTQALFRSLSTLRTPISFELLGRGGRVSVILSSRPENRDVLLGQVRAFFPTARLEVGEELLFSAWKESEETFSVLEFGLSREFMLPLLRAKKFSPDPLTSIVAALAEAKDGEIALLQVLFQGVRSPWRENVLRSVVTPAGDPFFVDAPEITELAREKVSEPLFAVAIRIALRAEERVRLWTLLRGIAGALSSTVESENGLVPLGEREPLDLLEDVLFRTTHRSGSILSLSELATLVHLPSDDVRGVVREEARSKRAPSEGDSGIFLGINIHHGEQRKVRLSTDERMRHVHVVGASGTGKSTLLVFMILQDIILGHGVGVIDPHGDLIDEVMARMPEKRKEDLILFDPADPEYAVGWNILSAHSEGEKEMLASDLVAVFRRLSTSWGDQMTAVLANAILAFLESERGGTLLDLRRFLVDASFRKNFLATVKDPYARDFWREGFPLLQGKPQGPILTRLDTLLRSKLVRGVVSAEGRPLDFRRVVDDGRIFLAKLSQGAIGEENAALLGSLLVSKFHQVSLLRQDQRGEARRPFFLYLDEFHDLATPSMASLFSGARKYRLGLTVAHQDLYQLHSKAPEVERTVLANAYTRILFRLGDEDARALSRGLSYFTAEDLGNLKTGEAIVRLGRREDDFNLATTRFGTKVGETEEKKRSDLRLFSLERWSTPRVQQEPTAEATREDKPSRVEEPKGRVAPSPVVSSPSVEERRAEERRAVDEEKPVEVATPPQDKPPEEVRRAGKGGPEHTYLQELVKRAAEDRGFRAVVEEQIAGSKERIDIALYRGDQRIACEISVTTPLEYEVENIEKCLAAGFPAVAFVSLKKTRLQKIEKLLSGLSPEKRERIHLFTPEAFLAWLSDQPIQEEAGVVRGYKVKVHYRNPGDDRLKRVAEILSRSMSGLARDE